MNKKFALTIVMVIITLVLVTVTAYAEGAEQSAANAFQVNQDITQRTENEEEVAPVMLSTSGSDQLSETGTAVTIALYDLGGAEAHPLFADRLTISDQAGRNLLGHTTRMAGIVATFAPNANINSHYNREQSSLTDGSADIAVHSWGDVVCTRNGTYTFESGIYDQFEMPLIFAAGNSGERCGDSTFGTILGGAQSSKNTITVGSTDNNGNISDFSSQGPTVDGRIAPTVVLPGEDVLSTCEGGTYCEASGTSYTAPAAGAIAAQLLEEYRSLYGDDSAIAAASLRALFANSAIDLGNAGPDYSYGFGQIDAVTAYGQLFNMMEDSIVDGATDNKLVRVTDSSQPLRITLAWHDAPSEFNAEIALVNDLDLVLVAPDGTEYRPFILNPSDPSAVATTGIDSLNTIEQIVVENPAEGAWMITISGANVTDQAYTVVYSENASATMGAGIGLIESPQVEVPLAISLTQLDTMDATTTTTTALFAGFVLIIVATVAVTRKSN